MPPRNDWVDPAKDVAAEVAAINAGLMSRRQAVAARGYDLEQLDAEIAADNERAASLGLSFNTSPPAQGTAP
jgi:capsid protein